MRYFNDWQTASVLRAFGSLGDIYPILALAREIKRCGHSSVIATNAVYRQLVESEGVQFHAVRLDVDVSDPSILRRAMDRRNGARFIFGEPILPSIRESYEDIAAATRGADMIVTHRLRWPLFCWPARVKWHSLGVRRALARQFVFYL